MSVRAIRLLLVVFLVTLVAGHAPPAMGQDSTVAAASDDATAPPQDAARRADRRTRVFKLHNADAEGIGHVLRETFADTDGRLIVVEERASNSVIISATDELFKEIDALLRQLDSPESQAYPGARPTNRELRVFHLRYAPAAEAAATISELYANRLGGRRGDDQSLSVAVDERTNTIIVHAPLSLFDEIAAVLKEIDARINEAGTIAEIPEEADDANKPTFQLVHLRHVDAETAADMLSSLLGRGDVRIVTDTRINALYVQANVADQRIVSSLLETIDIESRPDPEEADPSAIAQRRLLFYWLASGPEFTTGRGVPRQLEHVVEELQRLGLENVQLVSRSVAALDGRNVSLHSIVSAGSYTSLDLVLEGRLTSEGEETPRLDLNVRATHAEDVSHVETTITAPYNHFVVLGTTGLGNLENAFVIQIQSVEPARKESGQRE